MSDVAPGWYKDPVEPTTQRYWDGEGWVGDPLPADAVPPPGPPRSAVKRGVAPPPATRPVPPPRPVPATPPPSTATPPPVGPPAWPTGGPAVGPGVPWLGGPFVLAQPRPHGYPVAPLGLRFLARLIDFGVLLGLSLAANSWLLYLFFSDFGPYAKAFLQAAQKGSKAAAPAVPNGIKYAFTLIPLVVVVVWAAYEVPAIAQRGQTFGKRVVGIKVMALEGTQPLGFARALRRWNPLALPVLLWTCGLGFILQLVDSISPCLGGPLHLALHDRTAATVVVHSGRKGHEVAPLQPGDRP
jgi:uncharacterized RDD family membrane protein YckC